MRFDDLLNRFGALPWFDYPSVRLLFPEGANRVRSCLHRFIKTERLVELRRGLYAFAERYRKIPISGAAIAEAIYPPSYLSERWALSFYGVIPEKTVMYTSVTPRPTRRFENTFGQFAYRTLKPTLFTEFAFETIMGAAVRIAMPEKALLDFWYLEDGEWTEARMESMRFDASTIKSSVVVDSAARSRRPRLLRAAEAWLRYAGKSAVERLSL